MFPFTIVIITEISIDNKINVDLSWKFQRNIELSLIMISEVH